MGTTYRFITAGDEINEIIDWFHNLPSPPEVIEKPNGYYLFFRDLGELKFSNQDNNEIDVKNSPLVALFKPELKRGALCTVGEIHFLPNSLAKLFPELNEINGKFKNWLSNYRLVFTNKNTENNEFNYYLEGNIKNYDSNIYALPNGYEALKNGQYYVAGDDSDVVLEKVCKSLKLRGVECY